MSCLGIGSPGLYSIRRTTQAIIWSALQMLLNRELIPGKLTIGQHPNTGGLTIMVAPSKLSLDYQTYLLILIEAHGDSPGVLLA